MSTASQEVRELKQDIKQLSETLKKMKKPSATAVASSFIPNLDTVQLERLARKAGNDVRTFLNDTSEQATEFYQAAEKRVTKHPAQSIAIALAAGVVLASLLRSGSDE